MDQDTIYDLIASKEYSYSSIMGAISTNATFSLTESILKNSLTNNAKGLELIAFSAGDGTGRYKATLRYRDLTFDVEIGCYPIVELNLDNYLDKNQINEEEYNIAISRQSYVKIEVDNFSTNPLLSFHFQLKMLDIVVPNTILVVDCCSLRLFSGKWLKMTANNTTPPSPEYLYSIHGVYDELEQETFYWFHTHGLLRCGIIDVEMVNIKSGAEEMFQLINYIVKYIKDNPVHENTTFRLGYDGMNLNFAWLRWEEAIKDFPTNIIGGMSDREGENNMHAEPSGVLYAVEDGKLISPEIYVRTIADNPIFLISSEETARMRNLAQEQYKYFYKIFQKNHTPKEEKQAGFFNKLFSQKQEKVETSAWLFRVKLGIMTDNAKKITDQEHLWFDVKNLEKDQIEGVLLNQPYWISGLNKGDIKIYDTEKLTDWIIYSPNGASFTPDSIYQLIEF